MKPQLTFYIQHREKMPLVYCTLFFFSQHTSPLHDPGLSCQGVDYPALSSIRPGALHIANWSCCSDAESFLSGEVSHQSMQGQTRCAHSKGINKNRTCTKK